MENDKSLIDSYLYINYENSYKRKKEMKKFLTTIQKKLTKVYTFIEKFLKDMKFLKDEFNTIYEEKNYIDIFISIGKIIDTSINENYNMIKQMIEPIKKLIKLFDTNSKKYEEFFQNQKKFNNKLIEINKRKESYLSLAAITEKSVFEFFKKTINNETHYQDDFEEKEKKKEALKEELEKYKSKITEGNNELKLFNEKQKELFQIDKEFEIQYGETYSDFLTEFYQHQKAIETLISNESNEVKLKICNINTEINNNKFQDYLNQFKQKEQIDFVQYKTQYDIENYKDETELTSFIVAFNEMSKIIGNYKEVQMDKENIRIHLTTEIKKIFALEENIKDKDKENLLSLIKEELGQEIFINHLSQLRANGFYEKSQKFCELIGSGLNSILYYLQKTDNYAKARHCIILSQTFFYKDINNQKIHIFNYIKDNKWINQPKFWRGFIGIMLKTELDKAANFLKPKFGEVLLSQLLPYVNNMKQFGLDIRIIIKITDEFLEKYKYLNEQSYKILFNIISNDDELIEKYRKEYKENPDLENKLYNNENQSNPQNKNSIENTNENEKKNLITENELKKEEIQKDENENKKEQKNKIEGENKKEEENQIDKEYKKEKENKEEKENEEEKVNKEEKNKKEEENKIKEENKEEEENKKEEYNKMEENK